MSSTIEMSISQRSSPRRISFWQKQARQQLFKILHALEHGQIVIEEQGDRLTFGQPSADGLEVQLKILSPQIYSRLLTDGSLGAAEAFLQGEWECSDLVSFFRLLCRNMDRLAGLDSGLARWGNLLAKIWHRQASNTKEGSRRNIAAHYDLSNDFFSLFLDPTMMYSSAYYRDPEMSLQEASLAKLDLICKKLNLKPDDHVIEIGTGWGGFAQYACENYGCRVTTTTISPEQHRFAEQRISAADLEDRITLLLTDYRDLTGQYDKLVSIEMIEAVGHQFLPTYFQACESLLKPGGQMLIQSILMPDHRYDRYCQSVDFIQKYIFPGGHLPSISAIQNALASDTQLRLTHYEDFAESYAYTLRDWRAAFVEQAERVTELGFDDRFRRMWDYYLCYCEGAFLERATTVAHFQWQKTVY